jgi:hypothetical protein
MNSKLLTGLAAAALLLIGGPAFGHDDHRAGGGNPAAFHPVAASHRAVSFARHTSVAAARRPALVAHNNFANARRNTAGRSFTASRNTRVNHAAYAAKNRGNAGNLARGNTYSRGNSRNSVAFGGNANDAHGGYGHGQYAFASHNGWNQGRQYYWHGHHYGWYNNGWYIIDPFPYYGYGYSSPSYGDNGGGVAVQVQSALQQAGYYQGPIDGIIGPGTSAAIAAYQRDNGLRVTGTITPGLVQNLGVG